MPKNIRIVKSIPKTSIGKIIDKYFNTLMNKKIVSKLLKLKLASEVDKINIKDNKRLILIKSTLEKNKYLIIKSIIKDVGKPIKMLRMNSKQVLKFGIM